MAKLSNTPNTDPSQPLPDDSLSLPRSGREGRSAPPPAPMTYEQFLDWADEDTLAEWADGMVVMTSPASARHEQIKGFLTIVLSTFVRMHGLGAVYDAGFQMKLARSGREPDVIYIATEHLGRLKHTYPGWVGGSGHRDRLT